MQKKILTALFRKNSEAGFALIAAIMACLILLALGMLVISLSTQDIRVSTKIVGDKRALAAADTGIVNLSQPAAQGGFDPYNAISAPRTVNRADGVSSYTIMYPVTTPTTVPCKNETTGGGKRIIRNIDVVGRNTEYNTQVTIGMGVGYGPVPGRCEDGPGYQ